ncbi:MAG TPA: type II toxin-antitoxin system VapC family toxin [Roseiarcus sp.]|nr:type II toxin-antitoxin system VapC family toxin [Roseiarcus sp.]
MRLLPDTHILLWTIAESRRLSAAARALIGEPDNELTFSAVSLWEVAIKTGRGRADFRIDAGVLRRSLFDNGYAELAVTGAHVAALAGLPPIHKDPFDRMLVAQAIVEGFTLLTSDPTVAKYPGPIRLV